MNGQEEKAGKAKPSRVHTDHEQHLNLLHPLQRFNMIRAVLSTLAFAALFVASQPTSSPLMLRSSWTPPSLLSFSCDGQAYGYYADVDNNCQIFHICLPIEDDLGQIIETAQYSFVCGTRPSSTNRPSPATTPRMPSPVKSPCPLRSRRIRKIPEDNF
ncbi:Putative LOC100898776 [Caligus rogercresseyi]|uniref:LOC100898776 n=1 Tax=Caligus rogercresseyi TaxID=217165 RepID=A0A7T8QRU3_CALRO|nr:Putative LOC100898776 [Caligus rogercresseyi]